MRPRIAPVLLLLVYVVCPARVSASMTHQDALNLFATGNAAYRTQDYKKAAEAYQQILAGGYETASVYYNMGTTAARLGKKGEAIGYLLKARNLDPRNDDIRANLLKVDPPHNAQQPSSTGISAESVWTRITQYFTTTEWLALVWVLFVILSVSASIILLAKRPRLVSAAKVLVTISGVLLVVVLVPAIYHVVSTHYRSNVVVLTSADVLSSPQERAPKITTVPEGQILTDMNHEIEGYSRVKLPSGQKGFIRLSHLMKL